MTSALCHFAQVAAQAELAQVAEAHCLPGLELLH